MFNLDSSSVVRSLIGLFVFRSKPVSSSVVRSLAGLKSDKSVFGSSLIDGEERTVKDTAAEKLKPDLWPSLISASF